MAKKRTRRSRVTRKVGISPTTLMLHLAWKVKPHDEDELLAKGYSLASVTTKGAVVTFVYEKEA